MTQTLVATPESAGASPSLAEAAPRVAQPLTTEGAPPSQAGSGKLSELLLQHPELRGEIEESYVKPKLRERDISAKALERQIRQDIERTMKVQEDRSRLEEIIAKAEKSGVPEAVQLASDVKQRLLQQSAATDQAQMRRQLALDLVKGVFGIELDDDSVTAATESTEKFREFLLTQSPAVREYIQTATQQSQSGQKVIEQAQRAAAHAGQLAGTPNPTAGLPSVDNAGSGATPLDAEEWARNREDQSWRRHNRERIKQAQSSGLLWRIERQLGPRR